MSTALMPTSIDTSFIPPQTIRICSIYPGRIRPVVRTKYGKIFEIPAGSANDPKYFDVPDCFQNVYWGEASGERLTRILAEDVARDVINEVTLQLADSNAQEDAFPGVFICSAYEATRDELADHTAKQRRFLERQVSRAREMARLKMDDKIDPNMHLAAKELGISGEDWQQEFSSDANTPCPWCQKFIPKTAKICGHCSQFTKQEYAAEAARWATPVASAPETKPEPVKPPIVEARFDGRNKA